MAISKDDKIFNLLYPFRNEDDRWELPASENDIAHYGWEGHKSGGFYNYYLGYRHAFTATYQSFCVAKQDDKNDVCDTIIYPICFLFRQMAELFIKFLFIKHSNAGEVEIVSFLDSGHNINKLWQKARPYIHDQLSDQCSDLNIDIADNYFMQIHNYDVTSFKMRYPSTKKYEPSNRNEIINVTELYCKGIEFFDYLEGIDNAISNTLFYFDCEKSCIKNIEKALLEGENDIKRFYELTKNTSDIKMLTGFLWYDIEPQKAILIILFFYASRDLLDQRVKLSKMNPYNDFIKLIQATSIELNISFDNDVLLDELVRSMCVKTPILESALYTGIEMLQNKAMYIEDDY